MHEVSYFGNIRNGRIGSVTIRGARIPEVGEVLQLWCPDEEGAVRGGTYRVQKIEHSVRPARGLSGFVVKTGT